MGADGCRWVGMMRKGAVMSNSNQKGVRCARGDVCIHDLGGSWPGNFPSHHARLVLPKNWQNDKQAHKA